MQRLFLLVLTILIFGALSFYSPLTPSRARGLADITQTGGWSPQVSGTTNELRSVYFVSDNEGWTAGASATLLHTTNGGSTWTPVNTGAGAAGGFNTVRFLDQNTGFVGGAAVVARTTNGGANWTVAALPTTLPLTNNNMLNVQYTGVFPLAATQFWTGGGGMFQNQGVAGGAMALFDFNASGQLSLLAPIAVGNLSGNIKNVNDVQFFSTVSGLGVGDAGLIIKAELQQPTPLTFPSSGTTQQLNAIQMINATTGWIVGNGGVILTTTSGGGTWTPQTSGTTVNLRDVQFVDADHGWAVGDGGLILTTTNGGAAWATEPSGVTADLRGVFFTSANAGYAVGANGTILKRTQTTAATVTTVSAASFAGNPLAAESIAAAFGTGLATTTQVANSVPLPTTLAGTSVKVRDSLGVERSSPLFFISPNQINYQIPLGTAAGTANVTVTNGSTVTAAGTITVASVAPGLFTANSSGMGLAAAVALRVRGDGTQSFEPISRFDATQNSIVPVPISLGPTTDQVFLILFGTGMRNRSSLSAVTATIGGTGAEVSFVGSQPDFVGLDQANVRIPRSLAGRGDVDVALIVDGKNANTVRVNVGAN